MAKKVVKIIGLTASGETTATPIGEIVGLISDAIQAKDFTASSEVKVPVVKASFSPSVKPISSGTSSSTSFSITGEAKSLAKFNETGSGLTSSDIYHGSDGYGVGTPEPFWKWDVNQGSINVTQGSDTDGYRINGKLVVNIIDSEVILGNTTYSLVKVTDLNVSSLTASELTATDANKNLQSLAVATYPSLAEISYVKGVTNSIQDQIDLKFNIASFTDVAVTSKLLTGLSISGTSVAATDSILVAVGKLQAQVTAQLGGLIFQSTWNATTNTPTITSSTGTKGHYYIVSTAGATSIDGEADWKAKDWVVFNGATWDKVDNTDSVSSVNGEVGAVSLTTDDITEGVTNLYYTDAAVRSAISESIIGIDYNNSTGIFSTSSGYGIPTTIKQGEWDTAYTLASSSWLLNGNTIGAKKTFGSLDAYDVGIIRGGTEIVTIKNTGVNISGVTSSETINAGDTSVNIQSWIYNSDWSLKIEQKNVAGSHIQYNFNQNNNGVETTVMGIKQGKIGFGTEDPTAQHTIYGAGQATNTGVDTTGALGGAILIQDSTVGAYNGGVALFGSGTNSFAGIKGELRDGSNYTLGDLSFQTRNASTDSTLTTRFFIGKDGKVGVGTILPTELFDVNGTGRFTNAKITASAALGYIAVSDSSGSIIWTDPSALNSWQGNYNASTDTPSLNDGTGTYGNWYHVEVAGTNDFGSGNITFALGDRVIYDGSEWIKQTQNYTLNDASASVLGGIKIGSTLEIASGVANQKSGIVTVGTYRSVTVDTYGRVTGGTNPTTISGYGITDYNSLWDTRLATKTTTNLSEGSNLYFTNARAIASVLTGYTSGAGTISSADTVIGAIQKLNGKFGAITTNYYPLWDGTKFANGTIRYAPTPNSVQIGGLSNYVGGSLVAIRTGVTTINYYGTGQFSTASGNAACQMGTLDSGPSWIQASIPYSNIGMNLYLQPVGGNIAIGHQSPTEKLDLLGNFKYSGTLKPSGTAGTAGQFLGTDGTNDAWQSITQTVTLTDSPFERVLEGIYLAADTDESFFIGTDQENGQGVLRFKYYDDSEALKTNEMSFDREDNFRPYFYDPTATSPTYKKVAWLDELDSVNPSLQTVTAQGRSSTDRLQYSSGGILVNYALTSDIVAASGIDSVLGVGDVATDSKYLTFRHKGLVGYDITGIGFQNSSAASKGNIIYGNSGEHLNGQITINSVNLADLILSSAANLKMYGEIYMTDVRTDHNYTDDMDAGANGILAGQLYHTSGILKIKL